MRVAVVVGTIVALGAGAASTPAQTVHDDRRAAALTAWQRFTKAYGTDWRVEWNQVTGTPHRISGSSLQLREPITSRNAAAVALGLVRRFQDLLRADPRALVLANAEFLAPEKGARGVGTWYISLRQVYRRIPVEGGLVRFIVRDQKLTTMGSDFFHGIDLPTRPRVALEEALSVVRRDMGPNAPQQPVSRELMVWPDTRSGALRYHLVWQIVMPVVSVPAVVLQQRPLPEPATTAAAEPASLTRPAQWRYRVDAIEGSILERLDLTVDQVSGHVTGTVRPLLPTDTPIQVDIAEMKVTVTQGATVLNALTDAGGNYSVPVPAGAATLTARLAGLHVEVHNDEIADAAHTAAVIAPGTHVWNWAADDLSWNDMEENAYYHVKRIRERFLAGGPFNVSPLPDPMRVRVGNGPSTGCGACANPSGLFIGRNSALCADVYYHEYTHRIVHKVYDTAGICLHCAIQNGEMNEGWADYFAASFTNVPNFGAGCGAGRNISTPDLRFPQDWRGTVHEDSVIFSGALWDTRSALGAAYTDGLALRAMKQAPLGGFTEYLQAVLEEDDDPSFNPSPLANNNLADGTPNVDAICHAYYDLHGIHRPECAGHTQTPIAVIDSPSPLIAGNVFNSPSITIAGTAHGSSSALQGFTIEYARHTAPTTWLSAGVALTGGGLAPVAGGALGTLSTAGLGDGLYLVRLSVTDTAGNRATATTNVVVDSMLKAGWPVARGYLFGGSPAIADLDPAVPGLEVVARANKDGQVYVWRRFGNLGSLAPGWPKYGGLGWSSPAVGDLDRDGKLEIVTVDFYGSVYAFRRDGSTVAGWPKNCGGSIFQGGAVLADLDGNGTLEVVVASNDTPGQVCAWQASGAAVAGWPVTTTDGSIASPAVADLERDGKAEVVVATNDRKVYVLEHDGTIMPGWPQSISFLVGASPALGDLDGDGYLDVVAASRFDKVYAWRHTGVALPGWPRTASTYLPSSVALADVDGDEDLEVVVMTDTNETNVWRGDGTLLAGWPPAGTSATGDFSPSSPAIADIDGDGRREVLAEGRPTPFDQFWLSRVWAFHRDATMAAGWPKLLASQINSSPALADVDQDGKVDVVFGTEAGVYLWGLPGAYLSGPNDWLLFRHDNQRTGALVNRPAFLEMPLRAAVDAQGNVFVTEITARRIVKFSPTGAVVARFGGPGTAPGQFLSVTDLAIDPAGNVLVLDRTAKTVVRFTNAGAFIDVWNLFPAVSTVRPHSLVVDASGRLFVSDDAGGAIHVFSAAGQFVIGLPVITGQSGMDSPGDLALDGSGNLYAVDRANHRILKFGTSGPSGNPLTWLGWIGGCSGGPSCQAVPGTGAPSRTTGWCTDFAGCGDPRRGTGKGRFDNPVFMSASANGALNVSDVGSGALQRFDPSGAYVGDLAVIGRLPGEIGRTDATAVGPGGDVYAVQTLLGRVSRFTANGTFVAVFGGGVELTVSPGDSSANALSYTAPGSATSTISVSSIGGYRGPLSLTATRCIGPQGVPAQPCSALGITTSFADSVVTVASGGSTTTAVTITVSSSTPNGLSLVILDSVTPGVPAFAQVAINVALP